MFQVTAHDIAALNDEDLRSAIALTAEAEARRYGFAATSIAWSGDQRAKDGGVDVQADLVSAPVAGMTLPRRLTSLQIKAEKMPKAKIQREMRPNGAYRPALRELADVSGAYVILSSKESLSKTSLDDRLNAMRGCVLDVPNQQHLYLAFMDSGAIATWIRGYAGPSVWVLERVGRLTRNWRPFGSWAYSKEGIGAEYLLDQHIRVHIPDTDPGKDSDALAALEAVRKRLSREKGAVRIVGLSGVGKTRFAQALFDERAGTGALDPTLAIYTDVGDEPDPEPNTLISDLISVGVPAVVIVDNCRPALHRRLAQTIAVEDSRVSLLTIEYDVRDHEFEDTDVFELKPASDDLVEKLLAQRFPALSFADVRTIAKMSGGNLRIAIAIASTGGRSGTFASMKMDDLMERLFHQRNVVDPELMRSGQILSLPYSFDTVALESDGSELALLGALVGTTAQRLYVHVTVLQERDLVQQRGTFRALLPPGIANRLAEQALQRIPLQTFQDWVERAPSRLMMSVAHRLGFMHGSRDAEQIAGVWLSESGLMGRLDRLSNDQQQAFLNVAPLRPDLAIACIERGCIGLSDEATASLCSPFAELLLWLAHDANLFDRSVALLARCRVGEGRKSAPTHHHDGLANLFQVYLSGTHASIGQRIAFVESLVVHNEPVRLSMGVSALKSLLKTREFTGMDLSRFGTRSRDYGAWPEGEDLRHWYRMALTLCDRLDRRGGELSVQVRDALAEAMRDLWAYGGVDHELQTIAKNFSKRAFWPAGWIASKSIGRWSKEEQAVKSRAALLKLIATMRPRTLEDRVLTFVQQKMQTLYIEDRDPQEEYGAVEARVAAEASHLGIELASDRETLRRVLPILMKPQNSMPVRALAAGLAEHLRNPSSVWRQMLEAYLSLGVNGRKADLLADFLRGLQSTDPDFVEEALQELSSLAAFANSFPQIQCSVVPGPAGISRLLRSLKSDAVPSFNYRVVSDLHEFITDKEFASLFRVLASRRDSFGTCLHLMWTRLLGQERKSQRAKSSLKALGCNLLNRWDCESQDSLTDFQLATVVEHCMPMVASEQVVGNLCVRFAQKSHGSLVHLDRYPRLFASLIKVHPDALLTGLLEGDAMLRRRGSKGRPRADSSSLFTSVPKETLFRWCEAGGNSRFVLLASVIDAIHEAEDDESRWQPLALALVAKARNKRKVLSAYFQQFRPMSWSGSRASVMESNLKLFDELSVMPAYRRHHAFINDSKAQFLNEIERERQWDLKMHSVTAETFE